MSYAANPRADQLDPADAPRESTGAVASDSLAAESLQSGGGFAENENAHALGVKGGQSTLNTTDTSGATVLHPSASGATREQEDALGAGSDERGASGLKYPEAAGQPDFAGSHNLDGYTGGPSSDQPTTGYSTGQKPAGDSDFGATTTTSSTSVDDAISSKPTSGSGAGSDSYSGAATGDTTSASTSTTSDSAGGATGIRPHVDAAPNAFASVRDEADTKVPGKNLTEGDIPETKTFTGNVGGQYDPGRLAEQGFQNANADTAGGGAGERQYETGQSTGQFDVLSSERAPDREI